MKLSPFKKVFYTSFIFVFIWINVYWIYNTTYNNYNFAEKKSITALYEPIWRKSVNFQKNILIKKSVNIQTNETLSRLLISKSKNMKNLQRNDFVQSYLITNNIVPNKGRNDVVDNLLFVKEFANNQFVHNEAKITKISEAGTKVYLPSYNESLINEIISTHGIICLGNLTLNKYTTFSSSTDLSNPETKSFLFYLPLTVLAWKRLNFGSIVTLIVNENMFKELEYLKRGVSSDRFYLLPEKFKILKFVLRILLELQVVVILIRSIQLHEIKLSQVSRIFVPHIVFNFFGSCTKNVYIITSDADLWPINKQIYQLPAAHDLISLNSECCSPFRHKKILYKMLPLANIGATVQKWIDILQLPILRDGKVYDGAKIIEILIAEFGAGVVLSETIKGENEGWYLDQRLVSIHIYNYMNSNRGKGRIKFVSRDTGSDRLDKSGWALGHEQAFLDLKVDAHLPSNAFLPHIWRRLGGLLRSLHGDLLYRWCLGYYAEFNSLF